MISWTLTHLFLDLKEKKIRNSKTKQKSEKSGRIYDQFPHNSVTREFPVPFQHCDLGDCDVEWQHGCIET